MVTKLTEKEFHLVEESKVAVVDFFATWCGPCKMLGPVLEEVSNEMDGKVNFFKTDVDENMGLASKFQVSNIPAVGLFKDGKLVDMSVGFQPKEALISWIESKMC